jgi:hypothetical protein
MVCARARVCRVYFVLQVRELVDWMVGKTQRQAGAVLDFMHAHTRAETRDQMIGAVGRTFESNRSQLVSSHAACPTVLHFGTHCS